LAWYYCLSGVLCYVEHRFEEITGEAFEENKNEGSRKRRRLENGRGRMPGDKDVEGDVVMEG
jgi:hypothetical protein